MPYEEHEESKSSFMAKFEDAIIKGLRPTIPTDCPPSIQKLIKECWQGNQDEIIYLRN